MKIEGYEPTIYLLPEVDQSIRHWTAMAKGEVSGLGLADLIDGGFLVSEVFLPEQVCSTSHTHLKQESIASLLLELEESGKDSSRLRFWFHSHGTLEVFWSEEDEETIGNIGGESFSVSLVLNKRGKRLCRVDYWQPYWVALDKLDIELQVPDLDLKEECREQFRGNVKEELENPLLLLDKKRERGRGFPLEGCEEEDCEWMF